jgi:hypothetical protein
MKCTGRRAREKCEGYLITVTFFFLLFPQLYFLLVLKFSY